MSNKNGSENNSQNIATMESVQSAASNIKDIDYSKALVWRMIAASFTANIGIFIMGSTLGWTAVVQPQLEQLPNSHVSVTDKESFWYIKLNADEMSWIGAVLNLGALVGSIIGGYLIDKLGRKIVLIAISIPSFLGWLFFALAIDSSMLYIGRVLVGFAGGLSTVVSPVFVGEIATPNMRGPLGCVFQAMLSFGLVVSSLLGLGLDWRWISAALAIPSLLLLIFMIPFPETPYYLLKQGRLQDAEKALNWYRGPSYETGPEMAQMQQRLQVELAQHSEFSDLVKPWALKPVLVVFVMMFLCQFCGINSATFNTVAIFNASGSNLNPLLCNFLFSADQLVSTFFAFYLVERLGRRMLYIISMAMMALSMFALGTFFYIQEFYQDPTIVESISWLPLTSLLLFCFAFCVGVGTISWVLIGELLPAKVRALGGSVAAFTDWLSSFVITKSFIDMQRGLTQAGSFWFFGGICILGVCFGIFILPETKGKTPEEVQKHFGIKVQNQ